MEAVCARLSSVYLEVKPVVAFANPLACTVSMPVKHFILCHFNVLFRSGDCVCSSGRLRVRDPARPRIISANFEAILVCHASSA